MVGQGLALQEQSITSEDDRKSEGNQEIKRKSKAEGVAGVKKNDIDPKKGLAKRYLR